MNIQNTTTVATRAALYLRVSTIRQAEHDVSIPDQKRQGETYCDARGYQSKENAKHVLRALKENARQGFWNGSLPPIGYRIIAAEQRGAKIKKKLEIDPLHADTIRLIYRLALEGDGVIGQMGVKAIVARASSRATEGAGASVRSTAS